METTNNANVYPPQVIIDTKLYKKYQDQGLPELSLDQALQLETAKILHSINSKLTIFMIVLVLGLISQVFAGLLR